MDYIQQVLHEQLNKLLTEKFRKGSHLNKDDMNVAADLASKETSDKARSLVKNDFINLSAVANEVDKDAKSDQSAQSSVRKEVLGLGSDGKPDGKPMRADYAKAILKLAGRL